MWLASPAYMPTQPSNTNTSSSSLAGSRAPRFAYAPAHPPTLIPSAPASTAGSVAHPASASKNSKDGDVPQNSSPSRAPTRSARNSASVSRPHATRAPLERRAHAGLGAEHRWKVTPTVLTGAVSLDEGQRRNSTAFDEDADSDAAQDLAHRLGCYVSAGRVRVVVTDNAQTMVSVKRGRDAWTFRLHRMFLGAPPLVVRSLASYAESHEADSAAVLRAFVDANEDKIRRSPGRPVAIDTQGRHHDLREIFDDLNQRYFDGRIAAQITWGPRTHRRGQRDSIKLGSYTIEDKLIRIHPVLDAADVPRFFVESVVHHEMLHEVHDMPIVDGRRVYHTREFREAEAQFEHYAQAVIWERQNIHALLSR